MESRSVAEAKKNKERRVAWEICHCSCHKPGVSFRHIMQCCNECPHCGRRIMTRRFKSHVARCRATIAAQRQINPPSAQEKKH